MPDAQATTAKPSLIERASATPALHALPHPPSAAVMTAPGRMRPARRLRAVDAPRFLAPATNSTRHTLPADDFLKNLQRETRRAARSGAPLSLLVFRIDDAHPQGMRRADGLVDLLHRTSRETDVVGLLHGGAVAVLCPDTDDPGTKIFLGKVQAQTDGAPFDIEAATYPDDLFDSLTNGTRPQPAVASFLLPNCTTHRSGSYPSKRLLDIVCASLALIFFAPLMIAVALAIAGTTRGGVIFRQTRLGKGGVPFTFYKFRSMIPRADDGIHRSYVAKLITGAPPSKEDGTGAPYKLQRDPRITWIGRLIRKTSIDELPQLFNVLKGDMSLVGPRPPIPYEAAHYQPWHLHRVLDLTPGITGLWQVEGRSRVTFDEMVRMDLRYCRECSLGLDLRILLRTVVVVARCDGAV